MVVCWLSCLVECLSVCLSVCLFVCLVLYALGAQVSFLWRYVKTNSWCAIVRPFFWRPNEAWHAIFEPGPRHKRAQATSVEVGEMQERCGPDWVPQLGALSRQIFGDRSPTKIDYKKGHPYSNLSTGGPRYTRVKRKKLRLFTLSCHCGGIYGVSMASNILLF